MGTGNLERLMERYMDEKEGVNDALSEMSHILVSTCKWKGKIRTDPRKALKLRILRFLESGGYRTEGRLYELFIVGLILTSLALAVLHTVDNYRTDWVKVAIMVVESALLAIFLIEYALRMWSGSASASYRSNGGWYRYLLKSHMLIDGLITLSSLIFVLWLLLGSGKMRIACLLQLIRILRIDRQRGALLMFSNIFTNHRKELLTCWYMGFVVVVFISFLVYALETDETSHTVDNLFSGVYWGVVSLTSIGYGDINPETTASKILICSFAFFGACFLAMPAGIIGSGFAIQVAKQQKEKHVTRRRRPAAILIQSFWRLFAAKHDLSATWIPHMRIRLEHKNKYQRSFRVSTSSLALKPIGMISHEFQLDRRASDALLGTPVCATRQLKYSEKNALKFIRLLQCIAAVKKFRQAIRPYDERDILDQFATSHVEMSSKLHELHKRLETSADTFDHKFEESERRLTVLESMIVLTKAEIEKNNRLLSLLLDKHGIHH